jgi:hypothetical protein
MWWQALVDPYSLFKMAGTAANDGANADLGSVFGRQGAEPRFFLLPAFLFKLMLLSGIGQTLNPFQSSGPVTPTVQFNFKPGILATGK